MSSKKNYRWTLIPFLKKPVLLGFILITLLTTSSKQVVAFAFCNQDLQINSEPTNQGKNHMPKKSIVMDALYGSNNADKVYSRLQELDPILNQEIQEIAYDHFWARPGLNIRDKSLVTVVSLMTLGKEEQIRIHINGFLNAGGTLDNLKETLILLSTLIGNHASNKSLVALKEVLTERSVNHLLIESLISEMSDFFKIQHDFNHVWNQSHLSIIDKNVISVASAVAIGDQVKTEQAMNTYLGAGCSLADLKNILIHQIVYCGFPSAMNGFAALKNIEKLNGGLGTL